MKPNKSLYNQEYNENLAKQINTFLYMAEAFVNKVGKSEILEKLELKVLELANRNNN